MSTIRFLVGLSSGFSTDRAWVANRGAACTPASVLMALRLLGVPELPPLDAMSLALGANLPYGAPGLLAYLALPGRRSPLDLAIERVANAGGLPVRARTALVAPWTALRTRPGEVLVAHLAWGQERPNTRGSWGFRPLDVRTWSTGGHSVVVLDGGAAHWRVLDPNHPGVQEWARPGVAVTATRLSRAGPPGPPPR